MREGCSVFLVIGAQMLRPTRTERRARCAACDATPRGHDRAVGGGRSSSRVLGFVARAWYDSRLPARTASCPTAATTTAAARSRRATRATAAPGSASPTSRAERRRMPLRAPARTPDIQLASGTDRPRAHVQRQVSRPGAPCAPRATSSRSCSERGVEDGVTIHWHGVDVPNARGRSRRRHPGRRPAGRELHVPLPRRAGRDVLVPHAPGLVGGGRAGPLRRDRHRAAKNRPRRSTAARRSHVRRDPDARRSDGSPSRAVAPGTQVRLRLINTDSATERFSVERHAIPRARDRRHDLNGPGLLDGRLSRSPQEVGTTSDSRCRATPVRIGSRKRSALVLSAGRRCDTAAGEPDRRISTSRPTDSLRRRRSRGRAQFDRASSSRSREARFFDGRPGRQWAINGGIYPDVPMFFVERATSSRSRSRTTPRSSIRCTCTGITPSF